MSGKLPEIDFHFDAARRQPARCAHSNIFLNLVKNHSRRAFGFLNFLLRNSCGVRDELRCSADVIHLVKSTLYITVLMRFLKKYPIKMQHADKLLCIAKVSQAFTYCKIMVKILMHYLIMLDARAQLRHV